METAKPDLLIEVSYEVCNKVGGIYTVLISKAALMKEKYAEYITIGPYYEDKANVSMEQIIPPEYLQEVFSELKAEGIECIYGKWLVPGEPQVILIDFRNYLDNANEIKKKLWESYGVDTLFASWDYTEPMVWSWCVGRLIQKISEKMPSKKIVSHFHEWLAGIALLYLKSQHSSVKTVFTTHATMLGRAIAGSGEDLYSMLDALDPKAEAKTRGVMEKFTTEKACANNANVFTTVSEITGIEAKKILGREPDVLVLNGLDIQEFPTFEETSILHQKTREVMRDFISYYFFPYYNFDLDKSLTYFLLGRNEFRNKGIDIYIKSLGQLNQKLKADNDSKTIVSFIFVPIGAQGIRTSLLQNKNIYNEIKKSIANNSDMIESRILRDLVSGKKIKGDDIFSKDFLMSIKKNIASFKKNEGLPPLSTHNIVDEDNNEIVKAIKAENLLNSADDKVKVIIYPVYVSESDGLLDLKYYDVLSGGHMGVFASYYEPWGYTPLECGALGVPSVTSDLAGFGRYVVKLTDKENNGGIYVLKRYQREYNEVINDFTDILYNFSKLNKEQRVKQKFASKELSKLADWSVLVENYIKAHNLALERN